MKKYDFKKIEEKWQKKWFAADSKLYAAEDFSKKPKKYILCEFPYPSGEGLHVGHSRTYTMVDAFARYHRHLGYNVLFPMGWDAFGLPAENYAIKHKVQPAKIVKENCERFKNQMKSLGLSFDWNREINSTDPSYYHWTQWIFLQLFKKGLAYKQEMPINWCPSCKVGLANEEVVDGKHERCDTEVGEKMLSQWMLKITAYADRLADELDEVNFTEAIVTAQRNWIGRKEWIDIKYPVDGTDEELVVSTTSPETIFGVTFIVMAPEHPILSQEKGLVPEEYRKAVTEYQKTAAGKTAEDRVDEKGEKTGVFSGLYAVNLVDNRKVPIWVTDFVLMDVGTGAVMGVPGHDKRDFQFATKYDLPVPRVVVGPDGDEGEITKISQVQHQEGTVVNSDFLNGLSIPDAHDKIVEYLVEKKWGKNEIRYHLRDWIFSRQHYWGEPIPIIHCEKCGMVPMDEKDLPLELPPVESYEPTDTGESPLAKITDWVNTECPKCGGPAKRETDTMPNWAGSSWYFLRYCDAHCDTGIADMKKMEYWMPVDFYDGGAEHTTLHLLYSRFWHKFLNDIGAAPGKEPYQMRVHHGIVLGEGGVFMSKSRGNVINPDEYINEYGADVLRLYLLFIGPYEGTCEWNDRAFRGVDRFMKKFWEFFMKNAEKNSKDCTDGVEVAVDRFVKKMGSDISERKFNTSVAALMEFYNENSEKAVCADCLKKLAVAVAPFIPHAAEEFWVALGESGSVHEQSWPEVDETALKDETIEVPIQINGKVRGRVEVTKDQSEDAVREAAMALENVQKYVGDKEVKKFIYVPGKIVTIVI